jgi:hypothetical protein
MPFAQIREEPSRLLLLVALFDLGRNIHCEFRDQGLDSLLTLAQVLWRRAVAFMPRALPRSSPNGTDYGMAAPTIAPPDPIILNGAASALRAHD